MNTSQNLSIISLLVFLVFLGLVTILSSKKLRLNKSFENYLMGDRSFNWLFISFTLLGTYIGGGTLMGLTGKIGEVGVIYLIMPFGVAIAFFIFAFLSSTYRSKGEKQVRFIEENKPTSLVDRLSRSYSEDISKHIAIFVLLIMLSFIAVQLRAGGIVLSYLLPIEPIFANFSILVVVGFYIYFGGTRADVLTDLIQVLIILFVLLVSIFILFLHNDVSSIIDKIQMSTPDLINLPNNYVVILLGLLILPFFSIHTDSGIHQRVLLAKDDKNAKKSLLIASLLYLVFGLSLVFLTIVAKSCNPNVSGDFLLIDYFYNNTPFIVQILFMVAILSAVTSSIDSQAILFSTVFVNDIYNKINNISKVPIEDRSEQEKKKENFYLAKSWSLIALILGFSLTFTPVGLFDFLAIIWVIAISAFSVPVLGLLIPFLRKGISPNYIIFMLWTSILLVIGSSIFASYKGTVDLTTNSMSTAFAVFLLFLLIALIRSTYLTLKRN